MIDHNNAPRGPPYATQGRCREIRIRPPAAFGLSDTYMYNVLRARGQSDQSVLRDIRRTTRGEIVDELSINMRDLGEVRWMNSIQQSSIPSIIYMYTFK